MNQWLAQLPYTCIKNDSVLGSEKFNAQFEKVYMKEFQSAQPLFDDYGEPVTQVREDGFTEFVYPPSEPIYFWIDNELEIFVQLDFYSNDPQNYGNNSLNVEKLVFTSNLTGYEKPVTVFEYNVYKDPTLKNHFSRSLGGEPFNAEDFQSNFSNLPCFVMIRELAK